MDHTGWAASPAADAGLHFGSARGRVFLRAGTLRGHSSYACDTNLSELRADPGNLLLLSSSTAVAYKV